MTSPRARLTSLCLLALALFLPLSHANPSEPSLKEKNKEQFEVEIIVFQQGRLDQLPPLKSPPYFNDLNDVILADPTFKTSDFFMLSQNEFHLNRESNALSQQKNYQLLLHLAWQQSSDSKPVFIDTTLLHQEGKPKVGLTPQEILGTISIKKSRFFQFTSDLVVHAPCSQKTSDETNQCFYPFYEKRNLKSDEIHYFDHPSIGMLVKIKEVSAKETS